MEILFSSTSINLDRMTLVVFNSVGRRDMPLVSVATTSWEVSAALCSKIWAVDLLPENISSAYNVPQHDCQYLVPGLMCTTRSHETYSRSIWKHLSMATTIVNICTDLQDDDYYILESPASEFEEIVEIHILRHWDLSSFHSSCRAELHCLQLWTFNQCQIWSWRVNLFLDMQCHIRQEKDWLFTQL